MSQSLNSHSPIFGSGVATAGAFDGARLLAGDNVGEPELPKSDCSLDADGDGSLLGNSLGNCEGTLDKDDDMNVGRRLPLVGMTDGAMEVKSLSVVVVVAFVLAVGDELGDAEGQVDCEAVDRLSEGVSDESDSVTTGALDGGLVGTVDGSRDCGTTIAAVGTSVGAAASSSETLIRY